MIKRSFFLMRPAFVLSCLGVVAVACTKDPKPRGQLMLAISADLSIPKNMNQVTVEVLDESGKFQSFHYPLLPDQLGKPMPGTLAIVPPDGGGQIVRVRVRAENDDGGAEPTVRVVREAIVNIPRERTTMLTIPLRWMCDGMNEKRKDGSYRSKCAEDETCAAGVCLKAKFDGEKLPAYDPAKVFGGGDESGHGGECMQVEACFDAGTLVTPDMTACTIAVPPGATAETLNVGFVLSPGSDGHCESKSGRCYIPLDHDKQEGWDLNASGDIALPAGVCAKIGTAGVTGLAVTTACKTKDLTVPICGLWSNVEQMAPIMTGDPVATKDAGASARLDSGSTTCERVPVDAMPVGSGTGGTDVGPPPYVYLLVEESSYMRASSLAVQNGIAAALMDPAFASTMVGIQVFGEQTACGAALYDTPTVPFTTAHGGGLPSSTVGDVPGNVEPDVVLTDSLPFLQKMAAGSPSAVVLLASGSTGTCPVPDITSPTLQVVSDAATAGVKTYVLGFASSSAAGADVAVLASIAARGGTTPVMDLDGLGGPTPVTTALLDVQKQLPQAATGASASTCSYRSPSGSPIDASVTVEVTHGASPNTGLQAVPSVDACASADGFYVETDGVTFTLCPTSCAAVTADPAGTRIQLVLPCGSSVKPGGGGAPNGAGGAPSNTGPCASDVDCPKSAPHCVPGVGCMPAAGGQGGGGSFGMGGAGGAAPSTTCGLPDPCEDCACASCQKEYAVCAADSACVALVQCAHVNLCADVATCIMCAADAGSASTAPAASALITCKHASCIAACPGGR